ncbi:HNH endonuclease [Polyangium aurulentum]|uniref:HNH endonuclease n=1 Tax=Polyangium aurulentum TaxID=2567896 RepID=UPI001982441E|nr:HNH endonuclease [Polyangium aurulentum]UQA59499.1 HNH endonuclease [Polyangium aurulentum]
MRQNLRGPYADGDPIVRDDGTWQYRYFQENENVGARDKEFTNRGLLECLRDRVPVGVLRQVSPKPKSRYKIWGLAFVVRWDSGYFFLEGIGPAGPVRPCGPSGAIELLAEEREEQIRAEEVTFDIKNILDARIRVVAQIVRRRGQPEFRRRLLEAYQFRCAVTGFDAVEALEAAHITPYRGPDSNRVENGLLLRADVHTLFDIGLLAVDAKSMRVLVASALSATMYAELKGKPLKVPAVAALRPSREALQQHREWARL